MLDLSVVKKAAADSFEGQRKETCISTRPAWLIAVKERMLEFYSDSTQFINTLTLYVIQVLDGRNYFQSCKSKHSSLHLCICSLSLFWTASRHLDSLAYIESITDAFVNDIQHTENNKQGQSANYHLNKFLSASAWSSFSSLIISAENTA